MTRRNLTAGCLGLLALGVAFCAGTAVGSRPTTTTPDPTAAPAQVELPPAWTQEPSPAPTQEPPATPTQTPPPTFEERTVTCDDAHAMAEFTDAVWWETFDPIPPAISADLSSGLALFCSADYVDGLRTIYAGGQDILTDFNAAACPGALGWAMWLTGLGKVIDAATACDPATLSTSLTSAAADFETGTALGW